jgi:hypothetical protein
MTKKEYIEKLASIFLNAGANYMALAQEDLSEMDDQELARRAEQIFEDAETQVSEMPTETSD